MKTIISVSILYLMTLSFYSCNNRTDPDDRPMEAEAPDSVPVYETDHVDSITFKIDESSETIEAELEDVEDNLDHLLEDENIEQ